MTFKKCLFICTLSLLSLQTAYGQRRKSKTPPPPPAPVIATTLDSVSYAIGNDMGEMMKGQGLDSLNLKLFMAALEDCFKGDTALLTADQGKTVVSAYIQKIKAEKAAKNKAEGEAFLAQNKTKPGVAVLPSGLQFQVLKAGTGPKPTLQDKVKVHYHGMLIDGTTFDSSIDRGEPITLPVTGVIAGWTEALQLMPVGSKWKLFIPANLAYGERQAGAKITPNSTLVFDVELLEILPATPAQ
ncbi:FKBP-type peptidyl-prolyl cis-trans isomerase [Chitinophaga sp. GCM10012297]|uniref:Peptidyl-prolyl cis-trans isomerase n=1 Tax=Chitinophaga chungangae TaxID=2821488 RepID=A0ABS3YAG6_9BACT|nr:FKBP-type peptidyl-prolyl cis-trans isomerase [Chitinophaga chungangae]MBO9151134.1 FKBP-type peptidyl-prolyl cis-trans isomerase [Chitinophaga chungangae]